MSKLRILLIRNAYQHDAGGAEQYAINLAVILKSFGHTSVLVTKVSDVIKKGEAVGISTIKGYWYDAQGWSRGYYIRKPLMILWYIWLIITRRIDVVHPQGRDDFVFATQAARILHKRVIWTDHADLKYVLDAKKHPNPRMRKWLISAAKYTSKIVCVSEYERASINKVAPELSDKLTVIYNGVFKNDSIAPVAKTAKVIIGTNARLVPAKGIAELIEGYANAKLPSSELWILGGHSNNLTKYQKLAEKFGAKNRVKFIGYVTNPNDYMASMDIFVHASYLEAFSLAIVEAAMLGLPIIATRVGGTPEIIDNKTGILIPPRSAEAITEAILGLTQDPEYARILGKSAQKTAEKLFVFNALVEEKLIPLYGGKK